MDLDSILERFGIKDFDDLREDEKETYFKMLEIAESSKIDLEGFKAHVKALREGVETALASEKLTKMQDIFLKARLKNYLLFENFFDRPERARKMLESYKPGIKK